MPKRTSLEPVKDHNRYRLNVPAELSPNGKRQRLWFKTKKAAEGEADRIRTRSEKYGNLGRSLTAGNLADATEALAILTPAGVTLRTAATEYIALHKERSASAPIAELFEAFETAKASKSRLYRIQLGWYRQRFAPLGNVLARDLTAAQVEECISGSSGSVRNALLRYLRAALNFGIRRGWLSFNPVTNVEFQEVRRREVETFTPEQTKKLLFKAAELHPETVPYFAIGLFAGIRPHEITRLDWSDFSDGAITIRPEVSKTNRRRFVDVSDNLAAWIEPYRRESGPIITLTEAQLRDQRRAVCESARVPWIQQGMRHTFCSCWLALHGDINRLVLQSGHQSVDVMFRRYHRGTRKADAEKFWQIMPPKRRGKVIAFPAA
jgi:integrase